MLPPLIGNIKFFLRKKLMRGYFKRCLASKAVKKRFVKDEKVWICCEFTRKSVKLREFTRICMKKMWIYSSPVVHSCFFTKFRKFLPRFELPERSWNPCVQLRALIEVSRQRWTSVFACSCRHDSDLIWQTVFKNENISVFNRRTVTD
jgi:hypothetical protein